MAAAISEALAVVRDAEKRNDDERIARLDEVTDQVGDAEVAQAVVDEQVWFPAANGEQLGPCS